MRLNTCFPNLERKGETRQLGGDTASFQPHRLPVSGWQHPDNFQPWKPEVLGWVNKPGSWDHGNTRPRHQKTLSRSAWQHAGSNCFPPIEEVLKMKQKDGTRGWLIWGLSAGLLPSLPRSGSEMRGTRGLWMADGYTSAGVSRLCILFIPNATSTLHILITQTASLVTPAHPFLLKH